MERLTGTVRPTNPLIPGNIEDMKSNVTAIPHLVLRVASLQEKPGFLIAFLV